MAQTGTNERILRAGVVGAGFFGKLHARKYASLQNVSLTAVVDADDAAAQALASELGAKVTNSIAGMAADIDIVSITTPAVAHFELTKQALEAGLDVYVEKPIALTATDADELIKIAEAEECALQVGHQERFVFQDFGLLGRRRTPRRIECRRAGPFTGRAMDVSVVLDLMIHDLDLVHQVAPAPVETIAAASKQVHGQYEDEVDAHLRLTDGCEVRLVASRMADKRERYMRLEYDDGAIEIDFINRTLTNTTEAELHANFTGDGTLPAIADDPLGYAIGSFIAAIRAGDEPVVSGADARRALSSALKIIEACHAPQT